MSPGDIGMMFRRDETQHGRSAKAFTLIETVTAMMVLALFTSSVLVVINRCVDAATDSNLRMRAFEVARQKMEELLTSESLRESVDFGESERYPGIEWQTTVESFYEPITSRMWIRGVCSATYEDSAKEMQTVELTHWLTDLTKDQLMRLARQDEQELDALADQLLENLEDAAAYAGVDVETVEKWVENGLVVTDDGRFIKQNLDLYKQAGGEPTPEQQAAQIPSEEALAQNMQEQKQGVTEDGQPMDEETWLNQIDPTTGLTNREVQQMDFMELFQLMMKKKREGQQ